MGMARVTHHTAPKGVTAAVPAAGVASPELRQSRAVPTASRGPNISAGVRRSVATEACYTAERPGGRAREKCFDLVKWRQRVVQGRQKLPSLLSMKLNPSPSIANFYGDFERFGAWLRLSSRSLPFGGALFSE